MDTSTWIGIGLLAAIFLGIYVVQRAQEAAKRALAKAQADYENALTALEQDPADDQLRIVALELGREYAEIARNQAGQNGRAVFDEVALSNDLNARAGGRTGDEWSCPDCAETIKKAARKCRFCDCVFEEVGV